MMDERQQKTERITFSNECKVWKLMTSETTGDGGLLSKGKSGRRGAVGEVDEYHILCR